MISDNFDVTAIIVNYNTIDLLHPCISALRASAGSLRVQIMIVDNASQDGSQVVLRRDFSDCELFFNTVNVGFGRANNQVLSNVRGRYLLLLNTDAFVDSSAVEKTVSYLEKTPDCAVLGVRLTSRDGTLQPSCRYFPTPWNDFLVKSGLTSLSSGVRLVDDMTWDHSTPRECDWVPGCYYLFRKEILDRVGLFDPRFFLYYEEVDHCKAVKAAGFKVMFYPHTTVIHIGGESAKSDFALTEGSRQVSSLQIESELLYFRKHHGFWGVLLSMLLHFLANLLLSFKWLVRLRPPRGLLTYWEDQSTRWSLCRRTSWGNRPTR